jgi:outer membrane protein OmpA-like peptidoglycan-associated protein
MLGLKLPARRGAKEEAEKPFWISFSDLMTALMVLFLTAMAVAMVAVTQKVQKLKSDAEDHKAAINTCISEVQDITREFPGVKVRAFSIDFGTHALFAKNSHDLSERAKTTLRDFVPRLLEVARNPSCDKVFKRVTVEGFASQSGTYMHNLNLSLQRAQRVLCVLLDSPGKATNPLSEADRKAVRELFLVGGSSFNKLKESDTDSQRIELTLDFLDIGKKRDSSRNGPMDEVSICPIDRDKA